MDYEKETEKLSAGSNVFKPGAGKYVINILKEPEETEYVDQETKETTPQIKLSINVIGEDRDWYVGKGKTHSSTFGQLMLIGNAKGGLAGQKITLLVKRSAGKDGKAKNEYTIMEAVDFMPQKEQKID